uniref:Kunitz-type anticoagulant protein HA11 n=1 Tax=Hyalomma asiaticum TaxID=266040 RepID=HA11_HYAAI|nr:Kunitz-type protein HA11 [Hyalomma asiaticum]
MKTYLILATLALIFSAMLTNICAVAFEQPKYCTEAPGDGKCPGEVRPAISTANWTFSKSFGGCVAHRWGSCGNHSNVFPKCLSCMTTCDPENATTYCDGWN